MHGRRPGNVCHAKTCHRSSIAKPTKKGQSLFGYLNRAQLGSRGKATRGIHAVELNLVGTAVGIETYDCPLSEHQVLHARTDRKHRSSLRLIELVEHDAAAFFPLSQAYGIPREDPTRADVLEEATKGACTAPVEMMERIAEAIELLEEMGQKGSRMLLSDVGCGALLCRAALEAASLNVFVNTKTLRDRSYAEKIEARCDALLAEYIPRAEACAAQVMGAIRS